MRIFAFRHVPFEGAGHLLHALESRGVSLEYIDLYRDPAALPPLDAAAGLIFLGGPMSANDPLPYLDREKELIRQSVGRGLPVLGICLGAQLIASALGAAVYRNPVKEIGWFPIERTPAAADDPLFACLRDTETVFHWHGETFDLPPGATWLARSAACRHQAFRVGTRVYGLQFHLEVTPEMIADWCTQDANCGDVRELHTPIDPSLHAARLAQLSDRLFGRWVDRLTPC